MKIENLSFHDLYLEQVLINDRHDKLEFKVVPLIDGKEVPIDIVFEEVVLLKNEGFTFFSNDGWEIFSFESNEQGESTNCKFEILQGHGEPSWSLEFNCKKWGNK